MPVFALAKSALRSFAAPSFMVLPIVCFAVAVSASSALCKDQSFADRKFTDHVTFDLSKIDNSLLDLKNQQDFPGLFPDGAKHESTNRASNKFLPEFLKRDFRQIISQVFGNPAAIQLKSCDGCEPNIEIGTRTVFIDPNWVTTALKNKTYTDSRLLLNFVLAHEVAHYVYESSIVNSKARTSPNGQPSYWSVRLHNQDFVTSLLKMPNGIAKSQLLIESIFEETSRHAEMDAIAIVILKKMNRTITCDPLNWLRDWTNVPSDLEEAVGGVAFTRLNSLKYLLPRACQY